MKKISIVLICFVGFILNVFAQTHSDGVPHALNSAVGASGINGIKWISFTDAVKANDTTQKKIFIDVYTKWCGWCKRMDATTYEDPKVVEYMNKNFYAVKLDAETRDTIRYKEKVYTFIPQNRANLIALELLSGQMSYPTSVYLDENFNMLTPAAGYQSPEQLLPQMKYFAENIYKTKKWDEFLNDERMGK